MDAMGVGGDSGSSGGRRRGEFFEFRILLPSKRVRMRVRRWLRWLRLGTAGAECLSSSSMRPGAVAIPKAAGTTDTTFVTARIMDG